MIPIKPPLAAFFLIQVNFLLKKVNCLRDFVAPVY
nr:MAG TPA: hypothetical protein [Caudoviricetes sp.]